jgi:hypothetical protein
MSDPDAIARPDLTLPEAEAAHLRAACEDASAILEYGSGGSTVMAAEMPGKRIWSVESDAAWADMMRGWLTANPPATGTTVEVIWADIGPTEAWGHPANKSGYLRYARYPLGVWERADVTPDLVLVDGRFRMGCALAAALHTPAPPLPPDRGVHRRAAPDGRADGRVRGRAADARAPRSCHRNRDDAAALTPPRIPERTKYVGNQESARRS